MSKTIRLRPMSTGHMTLAHPLYEAPEIVEIRDVPASVSAADVCCLANQVVVLREPKTIRYDEMTTGAIIR